MLKAVFLDMDETLCDTSLADEHAKKHLGEQLQISYPQLNAIHFCSRYVDGFYKRLNHEFPDLLSLLSNEKVFREALIQRLFQQQNIILSKSEAEIIHAEFNRLRFDGFDFFPNIKDMLVRLREHYTLVVITNGPQFSQRPKIEKIKLAHYADHIIVGGEEPEEKPASSIFSKALNLAKCQAQHAIHIGDSFACDIKGAAKAKIPSIWITSPEVHAENAQAAIANYIIYSVTQIEETINRHAESLKWQS